MARSLLGLSYLGIYNLLIDCVNERGKGGVRQKEIHSRKRERCHGELNVDFTIK
jgi:hypothetical protein